MDFNSFKSDASADEWLKKNSKTYSMMTSKINQREGLNGYRIVTTDKIQMGMVVHMSDNVLEVQLHPNLKGALRMTTLIFEMANAYLNDEHRQIDRMLLEGVISSKEEFGVAHEIYEYEALRIHRQVLVEISKVVDDMSQDFYYFVTPPAKSIEEYQIPKLYDYMLSQKESGHTAHYHAEYMRLLSNQQKSNAGGQEDVKGKRWPQRFWKNVRSLFQRKEK